MSLSITELGLTTKTLNCLRAESIKTLEELEAYIKQFGVNGLLRIPNFGPKSLDEIKVKVLNQTALYKIKKPEIKAADMELRDYFAAKAMQSLASQSHDELCEWLDEVPEGHMGYTVNLLATVSYEIADAMLRARMEK